MLCYIILILSYGLRYVELQKWLRFPPIILPFTFAVIHTIVINCISAFWRVLFQWLDHCYWLFSELFRSLFAWLLSACSASHISVSVMSYAACGCIAHHTHSKEIHHRWRGDVNGLPVSSIYLHEKRQINRAVYLFRSSLLLTSHCLRQFARVIHELSRIFLKLVWLWWRSAVRSFITIKQMCVAGDGEAIPCYTQKRGGVNRVALVLLNKYTHDKYRHEFTKQVLEGI